MKHILGIIEDLRNTSSRKEKEQILIDNKDNDTWRDILYLTYNYQLNYYVRDISKERLDKSKINPYTKHTDSYEAMVDLLELLSTRELTGNKALGAIKYFKEIVDDSSFEVLELIIGRDIKAGVGLQTINKIYDNYIPEFIVMLAQQLDLDMLDTDDFYIIEEKMDGVRFEAIVKDGEATLYTRNGGIANIPTIQNELVYLCEVKKEPMVLSLEITGKDRQSVSGTINKFLKGTAHPEDEENLIANIFDIQYLEDFEKQVCNLPLHIRLSILDDLFADFNSEIVRRVSSVVYKPTSDKSLEDTIMNYYKNIIANGGEGIMVKSLDGLYEFKRSKNWLKLKDWQELEMEITGFTDGYGTRAGKIGGIVCQTADKGITVTVGTGLTDDDINYFTENKQELIGSIITVKYNSVITDKNTGAKSLFLPVFVALRFDKDEADAK